LIEICFFKKSVVDGSSLSSGHIKKFYSESEEETRGLFPG
jgi:hypothetical protein